MSNNFGKKREVKIVNKTTVSFTSILFFIFLILKLTGYIDWSWVWVTSPLWIPIAVGLTIMIGFIIIAIIAMRK